jgi:hypothetical protein
MNKHTAKHKIDLAVDLIHEVGSEIGTSDAYMQLAEMALAGQQAQAILKREAIEEQADLLTNFRSMHA